MLISKAPYYDAFSCLAAACPDSCCKEWSVQVDEQSAAYYRALPGPLGDRLRQVLKEEDGALVMAIENRRCPMWRQDGLCRIQAELGHEALCEVCRTFPRLRHDYGDFAELGLELSCPEAARLILTAPPAPLLTEEFPGGDPPEYDGKAMAVLLDTREAALSILSDTGRPVGESLALLLLHGYAAQEALNGGALLPIDPQASLEAARDLAGQPDIPGFLDFFKELELLTPEWEALLSAPKPGPWAPETLAMARYLVQRYWLQAVSDYDLCGRVKFTVTACILAKLLGGDIFRTAQLFSKEIENDLDNVEALLDAAYTHPAFTDDKLLALLLL